ncbi:hypothetical protein [Amphibacillus sediminis]|uniref:hypothetical protein n=1 Tax=Amphibacillus sediminis TaxID=360185 RepID=UPI000835FA40|nr:hypothetical protein [Amphibacillus sediminis]
MYQGKRVLLIGARKKLLIKIGELLNQDGFQSNYTTAVRKVDEIILAHDASQYDLIVFDQGLAETDLQILQDKFNYQNPQIKLVQWMASIPSLIVDQIKLASHDVIVKSLSFEFLIDNQLQLKGIAPSHVLIKHYYLNLFQQTKEQIVLNFKLDQGEMVVSLPKKKRNSFIVITVDDRVLAIHNQTKEELLTQ